MLSETAVERRVRRLLIIEDSRPLCAALTAALAARADDIVSVHTLAAAKGELAAHEYDAIILDVHLPDGDALALLPVLRALRPQPYLVAMSGAATADQAFRLAQAGVRAFVPKPLVLEHFERVWVETLSKPPDLEPLTRATVGTAPMSEVQEGLRNALLDEAMARSKGSRRGAAKLLSISRQLMQYLLGRR